MEKIETNLSDIPATLLVPLWARAAELEQENPIVRDEKSREMLQALDFDFGRFAKGWMSQVGVAIRTMILDRETQRFLTDNPGATVVNLGCGLDARVLRMQGYGRWYDLDVAETIALRERFFTQSERYRMVACSAFDFRWADFVEEEGPVLIIAEGLLMYFSGEQVRALFGMLAGRFPGAVALIELLAPFAVGRNRYHDTVKRGADFRWSLVDSRDLERMDGRIRFDREWSYFDYHPRRWRYLRHLRHWRWFRRNMNNRIVRLHFSK